MVGGAGGWEFAERALNELLDALGEPGGPRALLVHASNIVVSAPRATHVAERLAALDLLVVCDLVMSETAALADVVLPVAPHAERNGSFVNWEGRVRHFEASLDTTAIADHRVLHMLADEMGTFLGTRTVTETRRALEATQAPRAHGYPPRIRRAAPPQPDAGEAVLATWRERLAGRGAPESAHETFVHTSTRCVPTGSVWNMS